MHAVSNHQRHEFRYLLHLTTAGCGLFMDEVFDQERELPVGSAFLAPMPSATSYTAQAGHDWEMLWVFFHGDAACSFAEQIIQRHQSHVFDGLDKTACMPAMKRMLELQMAGGMHQSRAAGLLCEMLHGLLEQPSHALPSELLAAQLFMQEHFTDPDLSIDTVAAHSGLSRSHFTRSFRKHCDCSPITFLTHLRLDKAIDHISSGKQSITEIAQAVGFHEAAYFNNVFKKRYGYPPGRLRALGQFA